MALVVYLGPGIFHPVYAAVFSFLSKSFLGLIKNAMS